MAASTNDNSSAQFRFKEALQSFPIHRRCSKLLQVLTECTLKELQAFFPVLVEHIFGVNAVLGPAGCWGLMTTTRMTGDFDSLFRFLHPQGILFDVMYKLVVDVYLKYEYPLTMLPTSHRQRIISTSPASLPPFYLDKLQIDPHSRMPSSLLLNAFELYMFHFAYHLVSPWASYKPDSAHAHIHHSHETVYLHLSDQYLSHFLPVETSVVLPLVPVHQASPIPRSPPPQTQPAKTSKLFRMTAGKLGSTCMTPPNHNSQHAEMWRSEALVHVAVHIWLAVPLGDLFHSNPQDVQGSVTSLPTEHHLRVLRNFIKHMHYFCNNVHQDNSATDELRRMIVPLCQRPLYRFLRTHIHHWPLDSSFLLILETYLSFLQPWRYINYSAQIQQGESCVVDSRWSSFVCDNLVAYSVVIREMIPRFQRLDLTTPRHAHMLYRLAKVISQPNLAAVIRDVERCVDEAQTQVPGSVVGSALAQRVHAIVKSQLMELEPTAHVSYQPLLFDSASQPKVLELLLACQAALIGVKSSMESHMAERAARSVSLLGAIKEWLMMPVSAEDYSLTDTEKTVTYLEHSIAMLSEVFQVKLPEIQIPGPVPWDTSAVNYTSGDSFNYSNVSGAGDASMLGAINPKLWKSRSKLIKYEATPELQPVRSTEIAAVVRLLHQLCSRLNQVYGPQLSSWYGRRDLWGAVTRQLLAAPCETRCLDKRFSPPKMAAHQLPARLSLRPLASQSVIFSFLFLSSVALLFGFPLLPVYIVLFLLFAILVFVRALMEPWLHGRTLSEPSTRQPFVPLDVSFNE